MDEVVKRVAKDGTQRGLKRLGSKNKRTQLREEVQAAVERVTGTKNWDPVVMMAIIAEQARTGYPEVDENGNPVLDADGNQVMVPPDRALAAATAAKVAPYLHHTIRPKEAEDDDDRNDDPEDDRESMIAALIGMGVKLKDDGTPDKDPDPVLIEGGDE